MGPVHFAEEGTEAQRRQVIAQGHPTVLARVGRSSLAVSAAQGRDGNPRSPGGWPPLLGVNVDGLSEVLPAAEKIPNQAHTLLRLGHHLLLHARRAADGFQKCFSKTRKIPLWNRLKWEGRGARAGRGGGGTGFLSERCRAACLGWVWSSCVNLFLVCYL